jgi:hypothetical protein
LPADDHLNPVEKPAEQAADKPVQKAAEKVNDLEKVRKMLTIPKVFLMCYLCECTFTFAFFNSSSTWSKRTLTQMY